MSSTHKPHQLLEPSNLLEPLDLSERQLDFNYSLVRPEQDEASQRRLTRTTGVASALRRTERQRRSPLKPILMVAGALACFGAGTVFPQLQSLTLDDLRFGSMLASASRPSADTGNVASKSEESKPAESVPATQTPNGSSFSTATNATDTAPSAPIATERQRSSVVQPPPAGNNAAGNQQPCPKGDANCLEGGAPTPVKDLTNADGSAATPIRGAQPTREAASAQSTNSEPADARASVRSQERAESSRRNKRVAHREATDQQSVARRNPGTVNRSSRGQDANRATVWRRDVASDDGASNANSSGWWQDRDANRASNGWRDRTTDDNVSGARFWGRGENRDADQAANWRGEWTAEARWQQRDPDRASNWRRDRYLESPRDDDLRLRAGRDGDFLIGRAERNEGVPPIVPATRYRW
jgi:hypothetical protein